MDSSPWLSLRSVAVTYPNGTRALKACHLDVAKGSFVVLLGPSGAGKSTLLRCINGLVHPTEGELHMQDMGGAVQGSGRWREHRRLTGMIFQQHHLIGRLSVLDNVLMGRIGRRGVLSIVLPWSGADKATALQAIDRVGLINKALERADALSGGQQQRVGIARALVQTPRLMLADEPVASLDPSSAERVLALLHGICKTDGLTAIVSLHQVELARRFADRIVAMRAGEVAFDGPPAELTNDTERAIYAGALSNPAPETTQPEALDLKPQLNALEPTT